MDSSNKLKIYIIDKYCKYQKKWGYPDHSIMLS